jgi:putative tryptophan/tyrosine transport system substrate-binding protein
MLALPTLSGCRPAPPPEQVLYLGDADGTADGDAGLANLRAALHDRTRSLGRSLPLAYRAIPTPLTADARARLHPWLADLRAVVVAPTAALAAAVIAEPRAASVVFSSYTDPVRRGLVPSLVKPGSRITGVSLADTWHAKRLDLLRDAFPRLQRLGVLLDRSMARTQPFGLHFAEPARALGLQALALVADTRDELDAALAQTAALRLDGWYIPATFVAYEFEREIIDALQRLKIPAIHATEQEVEAGALMAYAPDTGFVWDTLAELCLRVLGGEDAGAIPVQRPRRFSLAVRPRDEPRALRMDPAVVRRADRVY